MFRRGNNQIEGSGIRFHGNGISKRGESPASARCAAKETRSNYSFTTATYNRSFEANSTNRDPEDILLLFGSERKRKAIQPSTGLKERAENLTVSW